MRADVVVCAEVEVHAEVTARVEVAACVEVAMCVEGGCHQIMCIWCGFFFYSCWYRVNGSACGGLEPLCGIISLKKIYIYIYRNM